MAQIWHKCHGEKMCARKALIDLTPRWRNWETRRTQNPQCRKARGGSTPPLGTLPLDAGPHAEDPQTNTQVNKQETRSI